MRNRQVARQSSSIEMVTIEQSEYELLLMRDRAISALAEGMTIADCSQPDQPLIYANEGFTKITGYSISDAIGKNCRFLQGPGTDQKVVAELREAIQKGRPCAVQVGKGIRCNHVWSDFSDCFSSC